jgi:hypothetical protein
MGVLMHARIAAGAIVEVGTPTRLPVYFNGRWWDCRDAATRDAYIAAADWRLVVEVARPADTPTTTHDYTVTLVGNVPTVTYVARPWTVPEAAAYAAGINAETIKADTTADLANLTQAIADLATLLEGDTTVGSIRNLMGPSGAVAGTGNLRALAAQSSTAVISAASVKALIRVNIDLAQLSINDVQATRRVARQVLRLAKALVGDYTSADVGIPK